MRALLLAAGAGAAVAAVYYLVRQQDGEGDALDLLEDDLVTLTTSDETRLSELEPDTQAQARALIQTLHDQGIEVQVGQTLRTPAQEKAAVDSGHSAVKTHSWHELGRALDLYPIDPDTGKADLKARRLDLFKAVADAATAMGFRSIAWNADGTQHMITNSAGKTIWDGGHLEWRAPYGSIAEAVAAEGAAYGIA